MREVAAERADRVGQPKTPARPATQPSSDTGGPSDAAAMRSIQYMQGAAGNAAVQRLFAPPGDGPVVQRGFWGMDKPPNMPQRPPDLTERIKTLTTPAYASFQLRANWTKDGRDGGVRLTQSVVDEVAPAGPEAQQQVKTNFTAEFTKIVEDEKAAITEFDAKAQPTLESILDISAKKLEEEMRRYGFSEKLDEGGKPGSGTASLSPTADMAKLATAARELVEADAKVANIQIVLQQKSKYAGGGPMEAAQNRELTAAAVNADPAFQEATQNYQRLFAKHVGMFPILAAYRNSPIDIRNLARAGKSPAAAAIAAQPLMDKRRDITTTKENIASGKLSIYGLPNIVSAAKAQQGATAGSLKARFIDDRVAQVKSDKATVDMALGAIAAAAMVAATIATAGGAAVVAGAAAGVGVGIGAAQLLEKIEDFGAASAAGNTDLDRAKAISQSDPSLFWLAMDIAMFISDVVAAGALFKQLGGPVRKLISLRQAATGTAKVTEEEAAKITRVFEEELKPALEGLPQPAKDKIIGAVDPKTPMPAMIAQAGKGTWTWGAMKHMLEKTPSGRKVLELVDKHALTIAYSPSGGSYYSHKLKTVFIAEATTADDAMNALVHEVEHADWRMTGKSALAGDVAKMEKDVFVQRMCREEAAAEASTIKNKYAYQVFMERKVFPAPTEQIYHDAFVSQAQALKGSSLSEAEKIAICEKKGQNALFESFYEGKIKTSTNGQPYNEFYADMWAQEVALAPEPLPGR